MIRFGAPRAIAFFVWVLCAALSFGAFAAPDFKPTRIDGSPLWPVHYFAPADPAKITGLVILISDNQGWDDAASALAEHLTQSGRVVTGLELPVYRAALAKETYPCVLFVRDMETFSRNVEETLPLTQYQPPIILGIGAGSAIAYATAGTVLPNTFAAGIGLRFDPVIDLGHRLCLPLADPSAPAPTSGPVRYGPVSDHETPFFFTPSASFASQGGGLNDFVSAMKQAHPVADKGNDMATVDAAIAELSKLGKAESSIDGLPVVEIQPNPALAGRRPLVVFYSGDGGWRDIDKKIGAYLGDRGYPVVGIDSLRYFWRRKSPETMAGDLDRLIRHYRALARDNGVMLVGYSFGADVMPFMVSRMARDTKAEVKSISLLGIADRASFEIRLQGILGARNTDGPATLPELMKLHGIPIQCVYGEAEQDSVCAQKELDGLVDRVEVKGGHHFDGDYLGTADLIMAADKARASKEK
ncbi:MAG TPA: AcvB/VirJ family lysyl-phosphatidylglycerol hydrolase [Alphaproteobacteria bacterium]|nr:AcvB/VirJ family lysyl-phosphatidylglycerol hydrolase [Alphaproteobacteria bacterium]